MIALGVLVAVTVFSVISIYNSLVLARQTVREGWSGIDVQLKRRADLVPNLVETVKGYASHERHTLEEVIAARSQAVNVPLDDVEGRARAETTLSHALGKLFALSEAYPELRANENFLELQGSLEQIEDDIQMARRYFNGATRDFNVKVDSFPSNLIAKQYGFSLAPYFEVEDADRVVPAVKF
jgi:LemA protein